MGLGLSNLDKKCKVRTVIGVAKTCSTGDCHARILRASMRDSSDLQREDLTSNSVP